MPFPSSSSLLYRSLEVTRAVLVVLFGACAFRVFLPKFARCALLSAGHQRRAVSPGNWNPVPGRLKTHVPGAGFLRAVAPMAGVLPHRPHVDVPQIWGVLVYCGRFSRSFTTSTGRAKPAWGFAHRPEMQLALPQPRGNLPGKANARSRDLARGGTGFVACISASRPQ